MKLAVNEVDDFSPLCIEPMSPPALPVTSSCVIDPKTFPRTPVLATAAV